MRPLYDLVCLVAFVCVMTALPYHFAFGQEAVAPTITQAEEKPLLTPDARLAANEKKLLRPIKVELQKDQTIGEAIRQIGKIAELKVEFEGIHPNVITELFGKQFIDNLNLDCEDFQSALDELGTQIIRKSLTEKESEQVENLLLYQLTAVPTKSGVLISNPLVRLSTPCKMTTKVYNVSDFVNTDNGQPPLPPRDLVSLLEQHIFRDLVNIRVGGTHA